MVDVLARDRSLADHADETAGRVHVLAAVRALTFGMATISCAAVGLLDFQRRLENERARSNGQTLFDMPKIPTDNQIRDMLDPAEPELLHPVFAEPVAILEGANRGLDPFRRLGDHVLIALDGAEYFSSKRPGNGGSTEIRRKSLGPSAESGPSTGRAEYPRPAPSDPTCTLRAKPCSLR